MPDDAINQMHRYRDALIHIESSDGGDITQKSRPVFGGYALYPGYFNQEIDKNPYDTEIEEVGVGAFSLLPTEDLSGSIWLTNFLQAQLQRKPPRYSSSITDSHYLAEAPRIPYHGTEVTRFNDLVIVANQLGPNRDKSYVAEFEAGNAGYYHTKEFAFDRQRIERHVIHEARYLAVALDVGKAKREIKYIYPILSSEKLKRGQIDSEQAGSNRYNDPDELYWLFSLGNSLTLKNAVMVDAEPSFRIKLVSREDMSNVTGWNQIQEKYMSVLKSKVL